MSSMSVIYLSRFNTCCGVSTYTEQLASALAGRSITVSVLASDHAEKTGSEGCREQSSSVPSTVCWSEDEPFLSTISDIIIRKPDVVHIQHEFGIFRDTKGLLDLCREIKAKSPETKLVMTAHTVPPSLSGPDDPFATLLSMMDAVVVHSKLAKSVMSRYRGVAFSEIHVVQHGMMNRVEQLPRKEAEAEIGLSPGVDRFTLLSLGFMSSNKNHSQLLQLFDVIVKRQLIAPKRPHLIIAGIPTFDAYGKSILDSIRNMIESLKIGDNVSIFPEFIPFERMPAFYGASDLSVHLCGKTYHSSSGSIRMDLAHGIPVLAQRAELTEDLPEDVVQHFSRGDELIMLVQMLAKDPDRLRRMSERSYEMAKKNSWDVVAALHRSVYSKLFGGSVKDYYRTNVFLCQLAGRV